jgi:subtilase family serine protease
MPQVVCYTPAELRTAYDVTPLLDAGIGGRGRTVVLAEAAVPTSPSGAATDIRRDLAAFDARSGLPGARVQAITALSGPVPQPWLASGEEVLDTEVVHAIAPQAQIKELLLTPPAKPGRGTLARYRDAIRYTAGHQLGDVLSISSSTGEHCFTPAQVMALHAAAELAAAHRVTVVGSSGDFGAAGKPCPAGSQAPVKEVGLPASDPLVTSVGGTRLDARLPGGRYGGETVWNTPPIPGLLPHSMASGGGFSTLFAVPGYQRGVPGIGGRRGVPDVASDADPAAGVAVVTVHGGHPAVNSADGTSAGAPLWAGLAALADQLAGRRLGFLNPGLYRIGAGPLGRIAFHDVTAGNNSVTFPPRQITGYQAGPGWDPVTGWGSPNAAVLLPLLTTAVHQAGPRWPNRARSQGTGI